MNDLKSYVKYLIKHYYKLTRPDPSHIVEEDWDNLIILDGCRYDAFEKMNNLEGKLEYRYSKGSSTNDFLNKNFDGKKHLDTVYVTANPLVNYHVGNSFHRVIPVWKDDWCEEYNTVLPKDMTERTIKAYDKYSKKRLITHFVQPHYPFIGKTGRKEIGNHDGLLSRNYFVNGKNTDHTDQLIWNLLKQGEVDKSTIWKAYLENLEIVLKSVKKLLEIMEGKTVITSDHGNLFGEFLFPFPVREYGHPGGLYHKNLIKVPWFVTQNGERKKFSEGREKQEKDLIREAAKGISY